MLTSRPKSIFVIFSDIGFLILTIFMLVGFLAGDDRAQIGLTIIIVMWTINSIVSNGISSLLSYIFNHFQKKED